MYTRDVKREWGMYLHLLLALCIPAFKLRSMTLTTIERVLNNFCFLDVWARWELEHIQRLREVLVFFYPFEV